MDERKNIVDRFADNRYSRSDYFKILVGFKRGDKAPEFIDDLEQQWDKLVPGEQTQFDLESNWLRLGDRIHLQSKRTTTRTRMLHFVRNVAALLFFPLLIASSLYLFNPSKDRDLKGWAEIKCPAGVRTEFELPDGSKGVLNSNSSLKYRVNFTSHRDVVLDGEAFFEVVKNKKNKFTVSTSKIQVEVLGTSFNVLAYDDFDDEEVTLRTGHVNILDHQHNKLADLTPNQQFVLNVPKNQFKKIEVNAQNYISWIEGKLVIQNERFEDVAKRLSKWYNVDIEVQGNELKNYQYYATFENEPLDEVLRLISITAPIQYQEQARIRAKDGSFTKRKIKFRLNENRIENF